MVAEDRFETVGFAPEVPSRDEDGAPADPALVAEGWSKRYLADSRQAGEAEEMYRSLGFEVRFEKLEPEDLGPTCGECSSVVCNEYVMIYTRRKA